MTKHLRVTMEVIVRQLSAPTNVLEIGSLQEKNQRTIANLRSLFETSKYIGLDMRKGQGVDIVADAEKIPFRDNSFDLIICLETLEHIKRPWVVVKEIERVLTQDGTVITSSQQNYPIHKHPYDYYRYTPFGMASLFDYLREKVVFSISPPFDKEVKLNPQAVVLIGWKIKNSQLANSIKNALVENKKKISVHKPYRHRLMDGLKYFKRGIVELNFRQEIEFFN